MTNSGVLEGAFIFYLLLHFFIKKCAKDICYWASDRHLVMLSSEKMLYQDCLKVQLSHS